MPNRAIVPGWLPEEMRHYLAHTGTGKSIRDLARQSPYHPSTISRRIARVEQLRDDPLIDLTLRQLEEMLSSCAPNIAERIKRELESMSTEHEHQTSERTEQFDKEAMRVLRRLCEKGAVLAIAEDMDVAVVVREGSDGSTTRTAVVAQEIAQGMAVQGWIETSKTGRIVRYRITTTGRDKVKDLLAQTPTLMPAEMAMAEAPAGFAPALASPNLEDQAESEDRRKLRYNLAESPLTVLARRRDKNGESFLNEDLVRSGERLREDFELAQMGEEMSQNWERFLAPAPQKAGDEESATGYGPDAAKARVIAALRDLGPGLSDVALRCCCYLEGLESAEKRMGWSARSGKIVLRIALQRLKRHYEETLTPEAQLIG